MSDNSQRNNDLDGIRLTHTIYVILKFQQQKAFFFCFMVQGQFGMFETQMKNEKANITINN